MIEQRLAGKVALVTGSSRGIGRVIALRFAQEGADVAINYSRDEAPAHEVLAEVEAYGRKGVVIKANLVSHRTHCVAFAYSRYIVAVHRPDDEQRAELFRQSVPEVELTNWPIFNVCYVTSARYFYESCRLCYWGTGDRSPRCLYLYLLRACPFIE